MQWIRRHPWVTAIATVAAVAVVMFVLTRIGSHQNFSTIVESAGNWAYVIVFGFVAGDAVLPILPGETALNAGATLAANGSLNLAGLIVAGWLGAVVGDSALFLIARRAGPRLQPQIEAARRNDKVELALNLMGENAPVLIVAGRYVPGLRFVVNAMMGISGLSYRRFLTWSAIGGALWSTYTCLLAYAVGQALQGFPLASVVISGLVTTIAIVVVILELRRRRPAPAV